MTQRAVLAFALACTLLSAPLHAQQQTTAAAPPAPAAAATPAAGATAAAAAGATDKGAPVAATPAAPGKGPAEKGDKGAPKAAPEPPIDAKATPATVPVQRELNATEQVIRNALLMGVLALVLYAGFLLYIFARAISSGERIALQSQWGGFGSGLGGWRMSTSFSALLGAFLVLLLAAFLAASLLDRGKDVQQPKEGKGTGTSTDKNK